MLLVSIWLKQEKQRPYNFYLQIIRLTKRHMEGLRKIKMWIFHPMCWKVCWNQRARFLSYAVELVREQVASAVRAAAFMEKCPQSLTHWWSLSINMADVHERPFLGWCACQMAYKSRSPLALLSRSLQAILLWQYEDWPLSFRRVSSLWWAPRSRASQSLVLDRACIRGPGSDSNTPLRLQLFLLHYVLVRGAPPSPVKWTRLFNPDHCLRKAKWNTVASLHHDLGMFHLTSGLGGFPCFSSLLSLLS